MALTPRERQALWWYRIVYVGCITVLSIETMTHAKSMTDHHFWLGGIEVIGALLLLVRRTQLTGLVILSLVYAGAAVHTLLTGGVPAGLALFAASAWIIVFVDRSEAASTH
jgi:hypothetical protein